MKIVVIGGSGLIGSKTVERLRKKGHDVVAASPNSGVNTITGEGLADALAGAQVVVDVANSPSFEDKAALEFFETSGRNLLAAEAAAGVGHHVALSVVGTDRLPGSGYFRAKLAQENLIKGRPGFPTRSSARRSSSNSWAPSRSRAPTGQTVRLSTAYFQPIASDDVAAAMADVALAAPVNGTIEIAGPERAPRRTSSADVGRIVRAYLLAFRPVGIARGWLTRPRRLAGSRYHRQSAAWDGICSYPLTSWRLYASTPACRQEVEVVFQIDGR